MSESLDHARDQYRLAKQELEQRKWDLTFQLQAEIDEQLNMAQAVLAHTHDLVREIPEQGSLDQNAARLNAVKKVEELTRELKKLHAEIGKIGWNEE